MTTMTNYEAADQEARTVGILAAAVAGAVTKTVTIAMAAWSSSSTLRQAQRIHCVLNTMRPPNANSAPRRSPPGQARCHQHDLAGLQQGQRRRRACDRQLHHGEAGMTSSGRPISGYVGRSSSAEGTVNATAVESHERHSPPWCSSQRLHGSPIPLGRSRPRAWRLRSDRDREGTVQDVGYCRDR